MYLQIFSISFAVSFFSIFSSGRSTLGDHHDTPYRPSNILFIQIQLLVYILEETEQQLLLPRPTTNDLTTKIKELAIELERERLEAKALRGQLRKQSDEIEILQEKNKASESEIIHLVVKVKDLEQSLYPAGREIFYTAY